MDPTVPLLNKNVNSLQPTYFNNINPVILKSSLDINWSSTKVSLPGEKSSTKRRITKTFINKEATILANIDAVYNLLNMDHVNIFKTTNVKGFTYLIVSNTINDTGLVQYIQYRRTQAFGVALGTNWDYKYLDTELFRPYDGYDLTGKVETNWQQFINDVNGDFQEKMQLVICNIDYNNNINIFIIECIIAISCSNQDALIRIIDLNNNIVSQMLYLLSCCFEAISIIKPISTDNNDCYVVCRDIKDNVTSYINVLKEALQSKDATVTLYSNTLPRDFKQWLNGQTDAITAYQLDKTPFDDSNLMMYWNLPDRYEAKILTKVIQ
jgi:hypothetical protein